ncbi:hypothetical protein PROFUN_15150 [Planoprotostelium fungivorum]|uniref:G-protein coupled receptors family 1 profile domain-containing protein n=1 Tax=Planoprotostelium fungivorum TaxID=1890364 RepID=A0A2P6MXS5_9EUKA|nr:hypothetical protein PROFUN_15150 [Planoprotostelium fungivorum]
MEREAVLDFNTEEVRIISQATLIVSVLSLFGSSFMLHSYFSFSRGKGITKLIAHLAASDFGWAVVGIITEVPLVLRKEMDPWFQQTVRHLFQLFARTSVVWTCCIAFYLCRSVCRTVRYSNSAEIEKTPLMVPEERERKTSKISNQSWLMFMIFAWGMPLAMLAVEATSGILVPQVTIEPNKERRYTGLYFPTDEFYLWAWLLPIALAGLFQIICVTIIFNKVQTSKSAYLNMRNKISAPIKLKLRVLLYVMVFLVCWPLNFLTAGLYAFWPHKTYFGLSLAFSVFLNSQGFLNSVVYGFTNKGLRDNYNGNLWEGEDRATMTQVLTVTQVRPKKDPGDREKELLLGCSSPGPVAGLQSCDPRLTLSMKRGGVLEVESLDGREMRRGRGASIYSPYFWSNHFDIRDRSKRSL